MSPVAGRAIAEVETRSGAAVGSVVTSGLRSIGFAIGSVPLGVAGGNDESDADDVGRPTWLGRGIGGRAATPDGASLMRRVAGPAGLEGGGLEIGPTFGGATPSEVWTTPERGRVPDVARFDDAPETPDVTPEIAPGGADCTADCGRGACGGIDGRMIPADGFVPPLLGGSGLGMEGGTVDEPAGRVTRAASSTPFLFAGEGPRPSRSAKTALIRKMK